MSDYILCYNCGTKLYGMEVHDREVCERRAQSDVDFAKAWVKYVLENLDEE